MSNFKFSAEDVDAAISKVRNDKDETNWALLGYGDPKNTELVVKGSGEDGLAGFRSQLSPDGIFYGVVRLSDYIDGHETVKFVTVFWLGDGVRMMQKARVSTHKGKIEELLGQSHVAIVCSDLEDLDDDTVQGKVSDGSGSGSRVLDGSAQPRGRSVAGQKAEPRERSGTGGALAFVDEQGMLAALDEVRHPEDHDTTWAAIAYDGDSNNIVLKGKGTGDIEEMKQQAFEPTGIAYGLYRVKDVIDAHVTWKFVLLVWVGENVSSFRKAKIVTHKGRLINFMGQHHNLHEATDHGDISEDVVVGKVTAASGTKSNVLAQRSTATTAALSGGGTSRPSHQQQAKGPRVQGTGGHKVTVPKSVTASQGLKWVDQETAEAAVTAVRSDDDPTNWALFGYDGPKSTTAVLKGSGSGGVNELKGLLADDELLYGFLRVTNTWDAVVGETTKFVLILWDGEGVRQIRRARLVTLKGAWQSFLGQYHTDVSARAQDDLTDEIVSDRVAFSAGTKNNVK